MSESREKSWESFAGELAEIADLPVESVQRKSRVIEDLGVDSLALIELVVAMVSEHGLAIPNGLDGQQWKGLTAGELFEAIARGSLA